MPIPTLGTFSVSSVASGSTAASLLIPPWPGPSSVPYIFNAVAGYVPSVVAPSATKANWLQAPNFGVPHITSLQLNTSSTAHSLFVFRPLNWTYFPSGLAKNTTVIPDSSGVSGTGIFDDPGVYSTNYKYPTGGNNFPGQVADAAISSTNLMVCYQLSDGSWMFDTIASGTFGSTLTLTTGTPNRTGGAIPTGGVMFYFGAVAGTLKDPATGLAAWGFGTKASALGVYQDMIAGEVAALHPGDPLLVYDGNGTAADSLTATGYYGAY